MSKPVISVVIPTRNRPDTLEVCLRAMRYHTSEAIEIVVQDNCSGPETFEVVSAAMALDSRIRYSKAPFPSSMRQNFEYGLAAATGDYLSIIGDDDGYSIGSLDWLVVRLQETQVDAVRWNLLHYIWPSFSDDGEGFMDFIAPMVGGGCSIESGAELASKMIQTQLNGSWENICVYHGMISRRVYNQMKAKTDGVFFVYPLPDVYAHNIIVFFCETYLQINDVVSVYGISGHSSGASWGLTNSNDGSITQESVKWSREAQADVLDEKIYWQPEIRTLRYHDYASLKIAENYNMIGGQIADQKLWVSAMIAEIKMNRFQIDFWKKSKEIAPYDEAIFRAVMSVEYKNNSNLNINKRKFNEKIPSLRVKSINSAVNDDVEGAMLALKVINDKNGREFGKNTNKKSVAANLINNFANFLRRTAPNLSSRVFNSRFMPIWLWRYVRLIQWGNRN